MKFSCARAIIFSAGLVLMVGSVFAEDTAHLPAMAVEAPPVPGENIVVGPYLQPEWSARRPFPGVSVYVQPDGGGEFETGFHDEVDFSGVHRREWLEEIEWGWGHRLQTAVENSYANLPEDDAARPSRWREDGVKATLRWALANWGKIPLNPAVGVGWRFSSGAAGGPSAQLVLGDEFSPRVHWAANLEHEWLTDGPRRRTWNAATAVTYSVLNETLDVGMQAQWRQRSDRVGPTTPRAEAGLCLQYRPVDRMHCDAVVSRGREHGRRVSSVFLSVGFEFGEGSDDHDDDRERGGRLAP